MRKFTSHDYASSRMSRLCFLWLTVSVFGLSPSFAQRNLALYNLPGVPQSQTMNVGRMPDYNFHLSLPVISNISLGASSSGFSANDIKSINFEDQGENPDGSFFETDFSDFTNQIGPYNTLGFDFHTTILDAGFRLGKGYIGIQGTEHVQSFLGYAESLFTTLTKFRDLHPKILKTARAGTQ